MPTQITPMSQPKAPDTADLNDIYRYVRDLYVWLNSVIVGGIQAPPFTNAQLAQMVANNDLSQAGKFFFNTDMQKIYKTTVTESMGNLTLTLSEVG